MFYFYLKRKRFVSQGQASPLARLSKYRYLGLSLPNTLAPLSVKDPSPLLKTHFINDPLFSRHISHLPFCWVLKPFKWFSSRIICYFIYGMFPFLFISSSNTLLFLYWLRLFCIYHLSRLTRAGGYNDKCRACTCQNIVKQNVNMRKVVASGLAFSFHIWMLNVFNS